jgi:hypothetical protein
MQKSKERMHAVLYNLQYTLKLDEIFLFFRIGYPCPINYNPADYFVQILAFIPEEMEESSERIKVCFYLYLY